MQTKDLLKKIRRIEITTNRLVTDVLAGQYHSVFKGRGMEFDEVREYQFGDDVRSIDWNVTARTGRPHIKKYVEERELTVMLLVDASMSCVFGTRKMMKRQLAAETAALLAFSAIRNKDKVGLIFFTDKVEKFIPPRKGRQNVLRLVREILSFVPKGSSTDISQAVEYLNRVTTRKTVSFLISDFLENPAVMAERPSFQKAVTIAGRRHDLIALALSDPAEGSIEAKGILTLEDAETGETVLYDAGSRALREKMAERSLKRIEQLRRFFRSVGLDFVGLRTDGEYVDEIVRFFLERRRRKGR
jgi:uncharacterized protein (DUF58 family)